MGAVQFVENMDRTTLTISDEDFEKNVEAAVSAIAEKHRAADPITRSPVTLSEKGGLYPGEPSSTRPSFEQDGSRRSTSRDRQETGDEALVISGLLRTIQRPLSSIGRIFSEESSVAGPSTPAHPPQSNPTLSRPSTRPNTRPDSEAQAPPVALRQQLSAQEAAARQASAEAAEAHRLQRAEHNTVVETLASMFPDLDREIISDVVHQKEGRLVADRNYSHLVFSSLTWLQSWPRSGCLFSVKRLIGNRFLFIFDQVGRPK